MTGDDERPAVQVRRELLDGVRIATEALGAQTDQLLHDIDVSHVHNGQRLIPSGSLRHIQQYQDAVTDLLDSLDAERQHRVALADRAKRRRQ